MKNTFLFIVTFFCFTRCFGQETTERKNRLTDSVIERFYVLKSENKIRQGPYKALYQRRIIIAAGNYNNGKKTGNWDFYNTAGKLVEQFDYDINTLKYEAPLYKGNDISYFLDEKLNKTDTVRRPIKIGGIYFGYIPYVNLFSLPFDTFDINTDAFDAYVELLISPLGRLADYKVHLISSYYQYNHTFNMDFNLFSEADKTFIAAILNGKPIVSRIFIQCYITASGKLDFY